MGSCRDRRLGSRRLLITAVVGFVVYSLFGALVVGVFLYYATRPIYRWVDDRTDHPDVSATFTLLTVGLPLLLVLGYTAFVGIREVDRFLAVTGFEQLRTMLRPYVDVVAGTDEGILGLLRGNAVV